MSGDARRVARRGGIRHGGSSVRPARSCSGVKMAVERDQRQVCDSDAPTRSTRPSAETSIAAVRSVLEQTTGKRTVRACLTWMIRRRTACAGGGGSRGSYAESVSEDVVARSSMCTRVPIRLANASKSTSVRTSSARALSSASLLQNSERHTGRLLAATSATESPRRSPAANPSGVIRTRRRPSIVHGSVEQPRPARAAAANRKMPQDTAPGQRRRAARQPRCASAAHVSRLGGFSGRVPSSAPLTPGRPSALHPTLLSKSNLSANPGHPSVFPQDFLVRRELRKGVEKAAP